MTIREAAGAIRWKAISSLNQRLVELEKEGPVVSFTFDDFPASALSVGGEILKDYGARGTYYASPGLMNTKNELGKQFTEDDLHKLLEDGHELGSHTMNHVSAREVSLAKYEAEVRAGSEELERLTGRGPVRHFSYPYGHATVRGKKLVGGLVGSCRGNRPGINRSPVDLNLLRANSLYSGRCNLDEVRKLLAENEEHAGWLIFYTHDIAENPSEFGCRPKELQRVVALVGESKAKFVSAGEVVEWSRRQHTVTDSGRTVIRPLGR